MRHLIGVWLDVGLRMDTKKTRVQEEIRLCAQNLCAILSVIVNIIGGTYMIIQEKRESSLQKEIRYSYELQSSL